MAQPVLVRAYTTSKGACPPGNVSNAATLPPISSFAFADILRNVDSTREFQTAIDAIAEICAKNHMSLAEEYGSHLPPVGEITVSNTSRPHLLRPGMRRALTSVPEASSGSSEGSRKTSKKRGSIFSFRKQKQKLDSGPMRRMYIGSMGRSIPVGTTTALAIDALLPPEQPMRSSSDTTITRTDLTRPVSHQRSSSAAESSLQRLLVGTATQVVV